MKERELIELDDYIMTLEGYDRYKSGITPENHYVNKLKSIYNYNNFLQLPLTEHYEINGEKAHWLNMFIETDEEGNVLEEPKEELSYLSFHNKRLEKFQQARNRKLFDGFSVEKSKYPNIFSVKFKNEYLFTADTRKNRIVEFKYKQIKSLCGLGITLTESCVKHFKIWSYEQNSLFKKR